jgi:SNF2 family DNA or RNA helicase
LEKVLFFSPLNFYSFWFYLGANGLNLTEAQHVILVEPQLHRSVELQAIARVRRLGQKYNTYVYRVN